MKTYKAGDLVRVEGSSFAKPSRGEPVRHHIKAGAVCTVIRVNSTVLWVIGPIRRDCRPGHESLNGHVGEIIQQGVHISQVKLAKQAMKKRDLYAARR